jgi:Mg2+ and Co2+ transporter CorA
MSSDFQHIVKMQQLEDFKRNLNSLLTSYNEVQKQFIDLCEELDNSPVNEEYLQEVSAHLTIYLSEMDLADKKIKEISAIIERIKSEISN